MKKSEADQLQAKVNAKGGSLGGLGSTLGHEVRAKATKPKKVDLKQDNWIGSEDDFQIAVARLLDASGLDWFHVPNGGKRNVREGAKFKRMGVKSGVPDIIIVNPTKTGIYAGLCIELKVGKNRMSDSQREWERIFIQSRWHYYTAYGLSDVEILLSMHYGK
jgi:hypothetical protein